VIVDTNYYVLSLIQVLVCCVLRDFVIPLIVWRKYLKGKSYGFRFWFCVITQASLLINLVLLLGFFQICNRWTILISLILIYGLIAWNFSDKKAFHRIRSLIEAFRKANNEDCLCQSILQALSKSILAIGKKISRCFKGKSILKHLFELVGLTAILAYNIWFLSHNTMLYHSYQFSDIPVHQSWIYALEKGDLFVNGIYPFGMHTMIYIIRIIFGLNLREILLYSGVYQTLLLILGLYFLAARIFYAKYTPLTVVLIFSLILNQGRYAASLPQEAGMYVVIGIAYFMLSVIQEDRRKFIIEGDRGIRRFFRSKPYLTRRYVNINALLLMLCIALVINYHFYTAIAAIFLVIAIGLAYLPKILKKQYFIPLLFCGFMGAIIALTPIAACLAKGIPFQESMAWATSVISGQEWKGSDTQYLSKLQSEQLGSSENTAAQEETSTEETTAESNEDTKIDLSSMSAQELISYYIDSIYTFTSTAIVKEAITRFLFFLLPINFILGLLLLLFRRVRFYGHAYHALVYYMLIMFTFGAAKPLGIVELMATARISTFTLPLISFLLILPFDLGLRVLGILKNRYYQRFLRLLSFAACIASAVYIITAGWYHSFFDVNLAYYNESEYVLRHIKQSYDKHTYTIVSTTDEYYEVLDYGYHMQLSEFINMVNGNQKEFTFPTKYVFFFIEKRVLSDYYYGSPEVDLKYAAMDFIYMADTQDYYFQRAIIESQAYFWAKEFQKLCPQRFKIYFEDDLYQVYVLEQNTYRPYSLQFDYRKAYSDDTVLQTK
jgi:hypothetical protein